MKPIYTGSSIGSVRALALALRVNESALLSIAGAASDRYIDFDSPKKDGGMRKISAPQQELKFLQKRINRELFEKVEYPNFLYGGLRGRDYVQNAAVHKNAKVLITLDIKDFFPSISDSMVFEVFKFFFRMPDDVARVLSRLCTKSGSLPQGGCCSTYLSNLVFHDCEHRLFGALSTEGLQYTRLVDDISISSGRSISKPKLESVIARVGQFLKAKNLNLKARKTKIASVSNPEQLMEVTGLWLNRGNPRIKRSERKNIRSEVRRCKVQSYERFSSDYHKMFDSISGKVAKLKHLEHFEADRFRVDLSKMLPLYDAFQIRKTRLMIASLAKTPVYKRSSMDYLSRFYALVYRVNIVARTRKKAAAEMRFNLKNIRPGKTVEAVIYG